MAKRAQGHGAAESNGQAEAPPKQKWPSVELINWLHKKQGDIFPTALLTGNEEKVYVYLANETRNVTRQAHAFMADIADVLGVNNWRHASNVIHSLEKDGWLRTVKQGGRRGAGAHAIAVPGIFELLMPDPLPQNRVAKLRIRKLEKAAKVKKGPRQKSPAPGEPEGGMDSPPALKAKEPSSDPKQPAAPPRATPKRRFIAWAVSADAATPSADANGWHEQARKLLSTEWGGRQAMYTASIDIVLANPKLTPDLFGRNVAHYRKDTTLHPSWLFKQLSDLREPPRKPPREPSKARSYDDDDEPVSKLKRYAI